MSEWYYMFAGQQQGPVTGTQLKSLAATGGVGPDDLVWNQSMSEWVPARRVRGLTFAGRRAAPAPVAAIPEATYTPEPPPPEETYAPPSDAAPAEFAPSAAAAQASSHSQPSVDAVSRRTINLLRQTRPWALLISIILFIALGLMAFMAIRERVTLLAWIASASRLKIGGISPAIPPSAHGPALVVLGAIGAALLFVPAIFLMKYASTINRLKAARRVTDLEAAIAAQKSYWKFVGILCLIGILLLAVGLVLNLMGAARR